MIFYLAAAMIVTLEHIACEQCISRSLIGCIFFLHNPLYHLVVGFADVNELGLEGSTTDKESINVACLG
jgi:hypothetical protein